MQNNSNHGIDIVCESPNGKLVFIEVKGHVDSGPPRLSKDQKNVRGFVKSRLERAADGEQHWANVSDPKIPVLARDLLKRLERNDPVHYLVMNIEDALGANPILKVFGVKKN